MGIFDRNRKKVANTINEVPTQFSTGLWVWGGNAFKRYSDAYLWLVLNRIFAGLNNVRYYYTTDRTDAELLELARFIEINITNIVWEWWQWGFVAIGFNEKKKDDKIVKEPYFPKYEALKFDKNRNVVNFPVVYYSQWYIYDASNAFKILRENINNLNNIKNSEDYLTTSLGALGILSGNGFPINKEDKDEFLATLKSDYGTTSNKKQILLMSSDVKFTQMSLPIKDLALSDKVKEEVKLIAGFFNVPYDLIPFAGASTYNNQREAVRQFYSNCISPLAEVGLTIGRYIMRRMPSAMVPADRLTFGIDNVTELEDDRTADIDYKMKVADLIKKMKEAGLDATEYEEQLKIK